MGVYDFVSLMAHLDHDVQMCTYGYQEGGKVVNVAIECNDCCVVLMDFDAPGDGMTQEEVEIIAQERMSLLSEETVFLMDVSTAESLMGKILNNKDFPALTPFTQGWAKESPEIVVLKSVEDLEGMERENQIARILNAGHPSNNADVAVLLEEHVLSGLIPPGRYIIEKCRKA